MSDKEILRTANGQSIDMQTLILQNETVRAVGNMGVNARGDVIDNKNKTTATRSAQVNKNYRKQIGKVAVDAPIVSSKKAAQRMAEQAAKVAVDPLEELDGLDAVTNPPVEPVAKPAKKVTAPGGLASAIAKAKEVKQQPQPSPREEERNVTGVKKI